MKEISLTNHHLPTIISNEDAEWIASFNTTWGAKFDKHGKVSGIKSNKHLYGNRSIYLHDLILRNVKRKKYTVDHKDRNPLNNQRSNLRTASFAQNNVNKEKRSDNTSGYTGVFWAKYNKKWRGLLGFEGKYIQLGYFDTPLEAAQAYDLAAKKHYGEYAKLNFPV